MISHGCALRFLTADKDSRCLGIGNESGCFGQGPHALVCNDVDADCSAVDDVDSVGRMRMVRIALKMSIAKFLS